MMLNEDLYTYRVTWSEDDREFIGLCAEFPGLSWLAASPVTALEGIRKVVAEVLRDMEANGEDVPDPFLSNVSAVNSSSGFLRTNTAGLLSRLRKPESASIGLFRRNWFEQFSL